MFQKKVISEGNSGIDIEDSILKIQIRVEMA